MELKHIVFHSPGPNWMHGVKFQEQADVMEHVQHYAKLLEQEKLLMGGPFTEADSGGMMIATNAISREALDEFAASDPSVQKGLLNYEI